MVDASDAPIDADGTADQSIVVLIVEDDFSVRWPSSEYLRESGYRVIEASTVNEGIAVVSSGVRIDVIFSDFDLRDTQTGAALAEWIGRHHPQIPVLLTSGEPGVSSHVAASPTRSFIPKPYALAEVDRRIRELLAHR